MSVTAEKLQFKKGDFVIYRQNGVCKITDIRSENFMKNGEEIYYVLCSVNDPNSKTYVPAGSKSIRDVLTKAQIDSVIAKTELNNELWLDDARQRAMHFEELLHSGRSEDVLWLVKILSLHKKEVESQNKKFYASDEKILDAATKIITEEFAFVLGIGAGEVIPYVMKQIEKTQEGDNT